MIRNSKPLTLAEVTELAGDSDKEKEVKSFIKGFIKMKPDKAKEMKKELEDLGLLKLKDTHIVKIVDFMPEDASDINKVVTDVSLDQDEVNKILEVVKKY